MIQTRVSRLSQDHTREKIILKYKLWTWHGSNPLPVVQATVLVYMRIKGSLWDLVAHYRTLGLWWDIVHRSGIWWPLYGGSLGHVVARCGMCWLTVGCGGSLWEMVPHCGTWWLIVRWVGSLWDVAAYHEVSGFRATGWLFVLIFVLKNVTIFCLVFVMLVLYNVFFSYTVGLVCYVLNIQLS